MLIPATFRKHVTKAASHLAIFSHACNTTAPAGTRITYSQSQPRMLNTILDNQYKAQGGETYGNQAWSLCHINDEPLTACTQQLDSHQFALQRASTLQQHMQRAPVSQQLIHHVSGSQQFILHAPDSQLLVQRVSALQQLMQLVAKSTAYRAPINYSAITDGQPDAAGHTPTAYGHMTSEQVATFAIVAAQEALTPDALASCLLIMDSSTKEWFLSLLTACHNQSDNDCSVLDSGSSKHLQDTMCVINIYSYHSCSSRDAAYIEAAATPTHNGIAAQETMSRWHHQMDPKADNASVPHNHQLIGTNPKFC